MRWPRAGLRAHEYLTPGSIALLYFVGGAAWILFSDRAAEAFAGPLGAEAVTRFQTYKGIGFIAGTAALLYSTLRLAWRAQMRSEQRYRTLLDEASDGIFLAEPGGRYLDVNAKGCEMLGYSRGELLALRPADLRAPLDRSGPVQQSEELAPGKTVLEVARLRRQDGTLLPVEISSRLREDGMIQSVVRDVSERRALEEQLRQAQKMEAVGQLTGGIAHDLNNVLATVVANADLARQAVPSELEGVHADLAEVRRAAHRGAEMIRKLLGFSRQSPLQIEPLDLAVAVDEILGTLRRLLPSNIAVERRGEAERVGVRADRVALEQILINLATNARDAMPGGGRLIVSVSREAPVGLRAPEGLHGWVVVEDTGHGMSEDVRARVFDPFFTTKPPAQGSGLGLAMVYGLVRQQQGSIELTSERGVGTTVTVRFPGVARIRRQSHPTPAPVQLPRGTETLLVVEDEPALRTAAVRILQRLGYTVLESADGDEALGTLRAGARVDLVLSDIMMPRRNGRALYEALRADGHPAKFLFSSGYGGTPSEMIEVAEPDDKAAPPLLRKPWTAEELAIKVREVLET
ncbi:MAG TPA: ATP-binding protein [Gemmatimonadales bacterium]|nr:ATP-binding protein [Gemmatimonadales bacterium]